MLGINVKFLGTVKGSPVGQEVYVPQSKELRSKVSRVAISKINFNITLQRKNQL